MKKGEGWRGRGKGRANGRWKERENPNSGDSYCLWSGDVSITLKLGERKREEEGPEKGLAQSAPNPSGSWSSEAGG